MRRYLVVKGRLIARLRPLWTTTGMEQMNGDRAAQAAQAAQARKTGPSGPSTACVVSRHLLLPGHLPPDIRFRKLPLRTSAPSYG